MAAELTLEQVSCPSGAFCVAVGEHAVGSEVESYAVEYRNGTWSRPQEIVRAPAELEGRSQALSAVSCASETFCAAASAAGAAYVYDGSSWRQAQSSYPRGTLRALSCAAAADCQAIFDVEPHEAFALGFDGTAWSGPALRSELLFTGLACPSPSFCAIGTGQGSVFTYDGRSWSGPTEVGSYIDPLSCASSNFCVGVAQPERIIRFDGRSWSLSEPLAPFAAYALDMEDWAGLISCAEPGFCLAISGTLARYYPASALAAPAPSESKPTLRVSPERARPGARVRLFGSVHEVEEGIECLGQEVELRSRAFGLRHGRPRGFEVVPEPSWIFSTSVRLPAHLRPGRYAITGRFCHAALGATAALRILPSKRGGH
jgi:hypothetical protein